MPPNSDGWSEWRQFVLKELERCGETVSRHAGCMVEIKKDVAVILAAVDDTHEVVLEAHRLALTNRSDLATLKIKAGLWGTVGAAIPTTAVILWQLLTR